MTIEIEIIFPIIGAGNHNGQVVDDFIPILICRRRQRQIPAASQLINDLCNAVISIISICTSAKFIRSQHRSCHLRKDILHRQLAI